MHAAVCLHKNGEITSVIVDQSKLREYFNADVQLCGAIDELNAICVSRRKTDDKEEINFFCEKFKSFFDENIRGDILLVGSDENGSACHLNVEKIKELFLNASFS